MAGNYVIQSQHQSVVVNPAGTGFEDVWEVTYKVTSGPSKGVVASVTVPAEDHTVDAVQSAIEDKIATLDKIASLGSK